MSNYRKEEWNTRYVIVSEKREKRPYDFNNQEEENNVDFKKDCPFCPGNEKQSEDSIYQIEEPWKVRVIPNKYPCIENSMGNKEGIHGYHYVVVESRKHNKKIYEFKEEEIKNIIITYINVSKKLYEDNNIKYIQIFKNYKREGGASLFHPHSQIVALNIVPDRISNMLKYSENFYNDNHNCLYCNIISQQLKDNNKLIFENEEFICFCPEASIFSYEVTIMKKNHVSFINFTNEDIASLCQCIFKIANKMYLKLGDIPLNICFYFIKEENNCFHFNVGIYPRISTHAGFEIATGIVQNSVSPEKAAKELRIENTI